MKYVIKSCDCYGFGDACLSNNANQLYCKDITDCVLKQIFNIVKDEALIGGINEVAENVLELLEIEECENG